MKHTFACRVLAAIFLSMNACPTTGAPAVLEVPGGTFTMGDGVALCASGIREVTLTRSFWLGVREVTNLEYVDALQWAHDSGWIQVVAGEVRDQRGSNVLLLEMNTGFAEITFSGGSFGLRPAPLALLDAYPGGYDPALHPVKRITWYGAAAYCDWLNAREALPLSYDPLTWICHGDDPYSAPGYRLPSDAEWERAARFDDDRIHPWGNEAADCARANHSRSDGFCRGWTEPVETHPAGVSALGLQNLGGNVGEWCNDWHDCDLPSGTFVDPVGPLTGTKKVTHGGGWFYGEVYTRCSNRDADPPAFPYEAAGLRVARTVPDPTDVADAATSSSSLRVKPSVVRAGTPVRIELVAEPGGSAFSHRRTIEVLSVLGRRVVTVELQAGNVTLIPTKGWSSGIYCVREASAAARASGRSAATRIVVID